MPILADSDRALLKRLLTARGPSGDEKEVREICREVLEPLVDELHKDEAGNLVGLIRAAKATRPPILAVAHMDEIAMIVKRLLPDGRLQVTNLGGDRPMSFGQCAVDILGDDEHLTGVLSLGSLHRTNDSPQMAEIRQSGVDWEVVSVVTGRSRQDLEKAGVHPGTRVVVSTVERELIDVGQLLGAHFMDDRALIVAGIVSVRQLLQRRGEMTRDVYFVCSTKEEVTNGGAKYAARTLPGDQMIALEVGPVAAEYDTVLNDQPILSFGDQKGLYSPELIDDIRAAAKAEGVTPQLALLEDFASDASAAISSGLKPQTAVMCIPTQNTHGFELIHKGAIGTFARVLTRTLIG
ncbi:hypothetical protein [Jiella sp. M17.18]|uniref:hypothetical protein n=1 Tax=Jiella sp. M17.18 TaxID=3234247 RepID=UPI0034DE628C